MGYNIRGWMDSSEAHAYEIGYDDRKAQVKTYISVTFWLGVVMIIASGFIYFAARDVYNRAKVPTTNARYENIVLGEESPEVKAAEQISEAVSSCGSSISASEPLMKELPASEWYRKEDGAFILRNVKTGYLAYSGFFGCHFDGFKATNVQDELIVENGNEIKFAKVSDGGKFKEVIQFTFMNQTYYVSLNSSGSAKILGWKQNQMSSIHVPEGCCSNPYPGSLFWAGASFFSKTTYARIKLEPSAHMLEVYRNSDNIICLKFSRVD